MDLNDISLEDLWDLDPDDLSEDELRALLPRLDELYAAQEALEPEDEDSEEYDEWEETLEDLDDLIDDIHERL